MSLLFTKIVISVVILQDTVMRKNDERVLGFKIKIGFKRFSVKGVEFVFSANRVI